MVGDNGSIISNGFRFAREGTKQIKSKFGIDCFAVYAIVYSIASVNDVFGMAENYLRGLQIVSIGR